LNWEGKMGRNFEERFEEMPLYFLIILVITAGIENKG